MYILVEVTLATHYFYAHKSGGSRTDDRLSEDLVRAIKDSIDDTWSVRLLLKKADIMVQPLAVLVDLRFYDEQKIAILNSMSRKVADAIKAKILEYPAGTRNTNEEIHVFAHKRSGFGHPCFVSIT